MINLPMAREPSVSIVIVAWREARYLLQCLQSVKDHVRDVAYEVIVVLNEPSPGLAARMDREVSGVTVMTYRTNLGFGGGVNAAAGVARGERIVLLNDDSMVEPGWLESLGDCLERHPRAAMVGSTYLHTDGSLQEAGSVVWSDGTTSAFGDYDGGADWCFEKRVDYCSGGSLLIRKDVWDDLGGFDDRYYPAYFEDIDLALRAGAAGWEVWYQPLSRLRHVRSGSSGRLHRFLYERSQGAFLERWSGRLATHEERGEFEQAAWRAMGYPLRVLILDDHLPDPAIGAGYGRMRDTMETLVADPGIHVAAYPTVSERMDPNLLRRIGVRVVSDLEEHLDTPGVDYEAVIVSRPNNFSGYRDLIRARLPAAAVIYDAEALFHLRQERQLAFVADDAGRADLAAAAAASRRLESSIFAAADLVVCISEEEAAVARTMAPTPVRVVAPWLRLPTPTSAPYPARRDVGLVAGWGAGPGSPNAEGLRWFAREVLPRVRAAIPGCRLRVTGANPPDDVNWLQGRSVDFIGHVEDLRAFYESVRVAISPTRFGAGVKLKTVEAAQYGVPMVATVEAARGLDPALGAAIWTTDDPVEFADAVIDLYRDPDTWQARRDAELAAVAAGAAASPGVGSWPELVRETVGRLEHSRGER